jgi:hypothetical protein
MLGRHLIAAFAGASALVACKSGSSGTGSSTAGPPTPATATRSPADVLSEPLVLGPIPSTGGTVSPVFEGWYKNPDGTFSLSFGYYSRNTQEIVDIPIGAGNFIEPGEQNQGQPTRFIPKRQWGAFAVKVPATFGDQKTVTWHVNFRGQHYAIPGSLRKEWEIDALQGEVGSGNFPPDIKFSETGPTGAGPGGITGPPMTAKVGVPMELNAWITDKPSRGGAGRATGAATGAAGTGAAATGRAAAAGTGAAATGRAAAAGAAGAAAATGRAGAAATGRGGGGQTLAWLVHQGTGTVTFNPPRPMLVMSKATTQVTFAQAGTYLLRLRVNEGAEASTGHAQCCWSNGFVRVTVTP